MKRPYNPKITTPEERAINVAVGKNLKNVYKSKKNSRDLPKYTYEGGYTYWSS